jgi:hypothetical protein
MTFGARALARTTGTAYSLSILMNRVRGAVTFVLALGCADSSTGPPTLHRIELRWPASATPFLVNDTIRLLVVGRDQADAPYPAGPVTWRSRNLAVIAVDSAGQAVGVTLGSATIVATVGRFSDSVTFDVAGTRHRVAVTANETWTLAGSPHVVNGRLQVGGPAPAGATLTIEAGATVQFADTSGLTFGLSGAGSLRAQGTPAAQITMRGTASSPTPAAWIGLTFRGRHTSELHHVNVSGCGRERSDDEPIGCLVVGHRFAGASPTILIDNVAIRDAAGGAVILQDQSRFAPGSAALSVRNIHGHIATLPAGEAAHFPLGGARSAIDTSEVRLTRDTVRESGTWDAGWPWVVLEPVVIEGPLQPVITIPAGVTIPFGYGAGFVVGKNAPGGLRIGTEGGAAVNLRPRAGTWGSVAFYAPSPASSIINATLESCGDYSETAGCIALMGNSYGTAPTPVIKDVTIRDAVNVAVSAVGGGGFGAGSADLTITGTHGNIGAPFWFGQSSPASIPSGTYTGNTEDVIHVYVDIAQSETWHNRGIPYVLSNGLSVGHAVNPTLTLEPGVELRFAPGGILLVGWVGTGNLRAIGTASQPIVFTGLYDFAGSWMGAMVGPYADTTTVFEHVILNNGGADDGQFATGFRLARENGAFIRHTTVRQSAGCGITRLSGTTWSTDFTAPALGNTFQNNAGPDQCGP